MKKYFRHKIENLISVKNIITIEYLNLSKDYKYETESHNFWELIYVDKESVFCVSQGKTVELKEGEILFHKPLAKHSIYSNKKTAPAVFILCFECNSPAMSAFEGLRTKLNKKNRMLLASIIEEMKTTFCYPFDKKLIIQENPNLGGQEVIRIYIELLLIFILREEKEKNINTIFLSNDDYEVQLVKHITEYFNENIYKKINIEHVCERFNYSKSYLSKVFKSIMKTTLMEYFTSLKIKEAKRLLINEKISITEISDKLSFSDPHYFSMLFKKHTGMPPVKYIHSIER